MATISRVSDTDILIGRLRFIVENLKKDTGINVRITTRIPDKYRCYAKLPNLSTTYPIDVSEIGVMDTTICLERVKICGLTANWSMPVSPSSLSLYDHFTRVIEHEYGTLVAEVTKVVVNKDRPVILFITTDRDYVIDSYRLNLAFYGYFTSEERFYNALRL